MGFLDGFEYYDFKEKAPHFHLRKDGVTFSAGVAESLGYPPKCTFLFRTATKQCALQGVDIDDERGVDYYDPNNLPPDGQVKWPDKRLAKHIADLGGFDLEKHEYLVHGYDIPETDAMMFDLNTAKEI